MIVLFAKYFQCDQFTKVKSSGACGMCGVEEKFFGGGLKQRNHLKDPGVDCVIILKRVFIG
jgi:hypothetical protein